MKKLVKGLFNAVGLDVKPRQSPGTTLTMAGALERSAGRGVKIGTVIDVGASDGSWTKECMKHFPDSKYLLIEAQEPHRKALDAFCNTHSNAEYVLAAAGKAEGKIYFDNSDLFGGLASDVPLPGPSIEVPVVSIDKELSNRNLKGPYCVKLDTHGFEIPILEGAAEALRQASLVIIETYNFRLTPASLRYFEMCAYLERLGFLPIEMVDVMRRDRDGSLWQMDTFFIPANSKEFQFNSFD